MHFAYAARLIARKLPIVLLTGLLGLGGGFIASRVMQSYTTTAYLSMTPSAANQSIRAVEPQRFFETESQLVLSDAVMSASAKALGNGITPSELRNDVKLGGGATDDVLQVGVSGKSPEESQARAAAVLKGIQTATPKKEITTSLLWTAAPVAAVSTSQLLLGGLLGGLLLGALGCLLVGAVRRPVLDPRFVQLANPRVSVYPRRVPADEAETLRGSALTGWLASHNPDRLPTMVVPVDQPGTASSVEATPSGGASTPAARGRFIVYTAPAQATTEGAVDQTVAAVQGPADEAVLLVTDPATSVPMAATRRAAVPQTTDR